ncbi:MAG: TIGR02147 family protein [Chitinivibrionales bacterium]|nr:TIGR02147 family protein [Chitinivibrionales bacterium]
MDRTVFDYQNYRHFLSDWLDASRTDEKRKFSQREILRRIGVSSTGFLSNVIAGRNNLTVRHISKLSEALHLKKDEAAYFEELVHFTQSKTVGEKEKYFGRMVRLIKSKFKKLKPDQLSLFCHWHYAVVRELIGIHRFTGDFKRLSKLVQPQISAGQAQEAVEELQRIGLITVDEEGVYRDTVGTVTTGDELASYYVAQFQRETMKKAQIALDEIPASQRDISVLTLRLSDSMFKQIKTEIQLFRKKLLALADSDTQPDRVYQCNFNFFPVTRKENDDEKA